MPVCFVSMGLKPMLVVVWINQKETKDMHPWHMTRKTLVPKGTPEHQKILKENLTRPSPKVWLADDTPYDYVTMAKWDTDVGQYRVACYHNRYRTVRYFPSQYAAEQFRLNNPRWETL